MEMIYTDKAPAAVGPYSQAVKANGFVFTSGQIAIDPATNTVLEGDIKVQAKRVMENLKVVLEAAGTDFNHVVKSVCFLADMGDFASFNEIYGSYFTETKPARSCVAVKTLPKNVIVEVELIAVEKA